MKEKELSVFIDESGDFGPYREHSPYYLVAMVLHEQDVDISANITNFEEHLQYLGYAQHAIHTGPLIRRESVYKNDLIENRKRLFNALFHFFRNLNVRYTCVKTKKSECADVVAMTARLSKEIANILRSNESFWSGYERVKVYYDNGQVELTKVLTSVFNTLYANVEFRKVQPVDYKLFQVADLICTLELLSEKAASSSFSSSELEFFGNVRDFKKNYLKCIQKRRL